MIKRAILLGIVLSASSAAWAEKLSDPSVVDISKLKNDLYIDSILDRAFSLRYDDANEGIRLSAQAFQLSSQWGYEKGKILALLRQAMAYRTFAMMDSASYCTDQAYLLAEALEDEGLLLKVISLKANLARRQENYHEALRLEKRQIRMYRKGNNASGYYKSMSSMATIMGLMPEPFIDSCRFYHLKVISEAVDFPELQAASFFSLGNYYVRADSAALSLSAFNKASSMYRQVGSFTEAQLVRISYAVALMNFQDSLLRSEKLLLQCLSMGQEMGWEETITLCHGNLGALYILLGRYSLAREHLENAFTRAEEVNNRAQMTDFSQQLARLGVQESIEASERRGKPGLLPY